MTHDERVDNMKDYVFRITGAGIVEMIAITAHAGALLWNAEHAGFISGWKKGWWAGVGSTLLGIGFLLGVLVLSR